MAKNGFLTFRAHESEPDMFEKFIIIFLPMLDKFEKYAWHIEEDNTLAKHIHCFFTHNFKDNSKITQYFLNKDMKNLRKTFNQTQWQYAWNCQMVKDTPADKMKALGYTLKNDVKRKKYKNIDAKELLDAVNYYVLTQRLDKQKSLDNDWKYLTSKNFHSQVEHFCKEKNKSVHDYDIKEYMADHKYSFGQLSLKTYNLQLAELRYNDNHCEDSRLMIKSHGSPCMEEIDKLQEQVKNLQDKLTIKQIQYSTLMESKTKTIIRTHPPEDYLKLKEFYNKHKYLDTKDHFQTG